MTTPEILTLAREARERADAIEASARRGAFSENQPAERTIGVLLRDVRALAAEVPRARREGYAAAREDAARVCEDSVAKCYPHAKGPALRCAAIIRSLPDPESPAAAGEEKKT